MLLPTHVSTTRSDRSLERKHRKHRLEIEYEKILNRVKQTRESVIKMTDRHFTAPVDEISGTVDEVSPHGMRLKEFPGRLFQFSVSTSAADMSARILGEH